MGMECVRVTLVLAAVLSGVDGLETVHIGVDRQFLGGGVHDILQNFGFMLRTRL